VEFWPEAVAEEVAEVTSTIAVTMLEGPVAAAAAEPDFRPEVPAERDL
jgi:hypothetical protein